MKAKMILPALTEAKSPYYRPIKYSLFPPLGLATLAGAWTKDAWTQKLRHVAHAGGWKKMEPLWDLVIRMKRVAGFMPLLETILTGRHGRRTHRDEGRGHRLPPQVAGS